MKVIASAFRHDVHHATKSAAVFGLNARGLQVDGVYEIKREIRVGVAAREFFGVLPINEVLVFRIGASADGISEFQAIAFAAGQGAARSTLSHSVAVPHQVREALQRLVTRHGSKLDDRLKGKAVWRVV